MVRTQTASSRPAKSLPSSSRPSRRRTNTGRNRSLPKTEEASISVPAKDVKPADACGQNDSKRSYFDTETALNRPDPWALDDISQLGELGYPLCCSRVFRRCQ